jgi:hypothetical protein
VVNIYVILQYEDNSGLLLEQYAVTAADSAGVTLTTAAVSLIGPAGIIGLPSANGVMTYSTLGSAPNYQFSAQYAVSVTYNAVNYYGTFTSNPDITIAADGSQVSWPYAADSAMIVLYTPYACMTMQMYGPYLTSPFDVNATGIYAHCAGDYQIAPVITDTAPITFGQTGVTGTAVMQILKMAVITKP